MVWLNLVLAAAVGQATLKDEFFFDLSQDLKTQPAMKLAGGNAEHFCRREPGGLRVTLPGDRKDTGPVGILTKLSVQGDFEITGTYEILSADEPVKGFGVGVSLWFRLDTPNFEAASAANFFKKTKAGPFSQVLVGDRAWHDEEKKEKHHSTGQVTEVRKGRLRLSREGTTLRYLSADWPLEEFKEFFKTKIGPEDLQMVRFSGGTGYDRVNVDVRLIDFKIRADKLGTISPPASTPGPESPNPLVVYVLGGFGALVLLGGLILGWRLSGRRKEPESPAELAPVALKTAPGKGPHKNDPRPTGR